MNVLLPSRIIIKKNPLEHPALIFAFIRFNKSISSFKESTIVVPCLSAVVKYKSVCLAF